MSEDPQAGISDPQAGISHLLGRFRRGPCLNTGKPKGSWILPKDSSKTHIISRYRVLSPPFIWPQYP